VKTFVFLITGLGYSSSHSSRRSSARERSLQIIRSWLNIENNNFTEIVTAGKLPGAPDEVTVKEIHDAMKRSGALCGCGKITSIFIAHSHGAVCLRKALMTIPTYPAEGVKLIGQMAIFTVGGLQILPKTSAKVGKCDFLEDLLHY